MIQAPDTARADVTTVWRAAAAVGLVLALALGPSRDAAAKSDSAAAKPPPPAAASALALQLEMAASDSFYLEIDPHANVLRLRLAGVSLREYPLLALELGTPRLAFVPLGDTLHVGGTVWSAGALDPPRPEVRIEVKPPDPNAPDTTMPVIEPPPPIEDMPVPSTYRIRYPEGLTLTVTSPHPAVAGFKGFSEALGEKFDSLREAITSRRTHVRLVLERADALHLFRSLPPGTRLLILPS